MTQSNYRHRVGELRPSQILFSYGIGAIADLPNLSVMIMGLEDWDTTHTVQLSEERLLAAVKQRLGPQVERLLSPPTPPDGASTASPQDEASRIGIPVAPFPTWMVCPLCRLLAPLQSSFFELESKPYRFDQTYYVHKHCRKAKKKPPAVIPARFLVACENGHLDDFPWKYFVHRGNKDCQSRLFLTEYGISGSATDIVVKCETCGDSRRLSDAFGQSGKENLPRCRGRHPHLRKFEDHCDQQMKGILLGASNSWFPMTLSALSIPSTAGKLEQLIEQNSAVLGTAKSLEVLEGILTAMQSQGLLQEFNPYSPEEIWSVLQARQTNEHSSSENTDLKTPEWETFKQADPKQNSTHFQLRAVAPPKSFEDYFTQTVLVERLREVRALIGFTRIQSPGDFVEIEQVPQKYRAPVSRSSPKWVPTTEVKGEGIFLQFSESAIAQWEQRPEVKQHEGEIQKAHRNWCIARDLDPKQIPCRSVRYVLIHSFSHALMRQLAMECGYNAASLRERLYAATTDSKNPQAGVLIYTAAPDSEGTLGGLVNLGKPDTLGYHIAQALEQMRICASDPLCAVHTPSANSVSLHWASCHACSFTPETSCEQGNQYLNRGVLVPTLHCDRLAFFT